MQNRLSWNGSTPSLSLLAVAALLAACGSSEAPPKNPEAGVSADVGAPADTAAPGPTADGASSVDGTAAADGMATGDSGVTADSGATADAGVAADVAGSDSGTGGGLGSAVAAKVAVGRLHTCALTSTGGVRCWGVSRDGQLGNNTIAETIVSSPVQVTGLASGATALASGADHSCAVVAGAVKCWGGNDKGQLGNNSTTHSAVPVDVIGLSSGVSAIAAGFTHTCAVTTGGGVKCWGENGSGQLGNDATDDSKVPVDVVGLSSGVASVAVGLNMSCAVTTAGAVKCWGTNSFGELGNDSTNASHVPVDVTGLATGGSGVSSGGATTCATVSGAIKCWGKNNHGQLGDNAGGLGVESHVPVAASGLTAGSVSISVGFDFACGVVTGVVRCWGNSPAGMETLVSVEIAGVGTAASVSAGTNHVCAVTTAGAVKCWGDNSAGALGNGTDTDSKVPVGVISLP